MRESPEPGVLNVALLIYFDDETVSSGSMWHKTIWGPLRAVALACHDVDYVAARFLRLAAFGGRPQHVGKVGKTFKTKPSPLWLGLQIGKACQPP